MKVVVGMPWRPGDGRLLAHAVTRRYYAAYLPDAEVIEVDTGHVPYNLAAARNAAVRAATEVGADVVVVADADCVFYPVAGLLDAIDGAHADALIHMPFRDQRYLTEAETVDLAVNGVLPPLAGGQGNGCCYVAKPDTYWQVGGGDERFSGWGGDDDQFVAAAMTLSEVVRHDSLSLSLWHPAFRDVGSERHRPNSVLAARYWEALGHPVKMRALIAERDYE